MSDPQSSFWGILITSQAVVPYTARSWTKAARWITRALRRWEITSRTIRRRRRRIIWARPLRPISLWTTSTRWRMCLRTFTRPKTITNPPSQCPVMWLLPSTRVPASVTLPRQALCGTPRRCYWIKTLKTPKPRCSSPKSTLGTSRRVLWSTAPMTLLLWSRKRNTSDQETSLQYKLSNCNIFLFSIFISYIHFNEYLMILSNEHLSYIHFKNTLWFNCINYYIFVRRYFKIDKFSETNFIRKVLLELFC